MICLVGVEGEGTVCEAFLRLLSFFVLDLDIMAVLPVLVAGAPAGTGGTGRVGLERGVGFLVLERGVGFLATTALATTDGGAPESWLLVEESWR